jgi:3',5'-cyclic-AMP phosphodiesterase
MAKIVFGPLRVWLVALLVLIGTSFPVGLGAGETQRPYGIALIGDPHLPGRNLPAKEALLRTIDGWEGIDRAVVLGDICSETGTDAEYAFARKFFGGLHQPLRFVAGNHDYIYEDEVDPQGKKVRASSEVRRAKLARFARTFGLNEVYSRERLGNYLLIYLSTDDLDSPHLAPFSEVQLAWLEKVLAQNRKIPTLLFAHAPLAGTLHSYNQHANTPSFVAQPAERLRALILAHPQIFLYAAGHMHVPATNESYASPVNLYEGRVMTIHNSDLGRKKPWTNVLYLYPERVVVRTYDHGLKSWRADLERTIPAPR